jgi:hypothetical protein
MRGRAGEVVIHPVSFEEAGRLYPKAGRRLPTLTFDAIPAEVPAGIRTQAAYEWMLTGPDGSVKGAGNPRWMHNGSARR